MCKSDHRTKYTRLLYTVTVPHRTWQTGSGKSYTMMGSGGVLYEDVVPEDYGLIPRVCSAIFDRTEEEVSASGRFRAIRLDAFLRFDSSIGFSKDKDE